jgi:hypothetical protein
VSVCVRARANTQRQQPTSQECVCDVLIICRQPASALECGCVFINLCNQPTAQACVCVCLHLAKHASSELLLWHVPMCIQARANTQRQQPTSEACVCVGLSIWWQPATALACVHVCSSTGKNTEAAFHISGVCLRGFAFAR